jgi:hypothetical protein
MKASGAALRSWHANISAFIAPMIFFYALSGALQIFGLHQSHGSYHAPAFITAIGRLHKDQVFAPVPPRDRPPRPAAAGGGSGPPGGPPPEERTSVPTLMLKWLFLVEALGLATTTFFGVWIGLTHAKRKRTVVALLVAGTVLPLVLIVLGSATL